MTIRRAVAKATDGGSGRQTDGHYCGVVLGFNYQKLYGQMSNNVIGHSFVTM